MLVLVCILEREGWCDEPDTFSSILGIESNFGGYGGQILSKRLFDYGKKYKVKIKEIGISKDQMDEYEEKLGEEK